MKPISRRNMLSKTSWVGTTVAVGLPLATTVAEPNLSNTSPSKRKLKVVVTGGHPGDPEYGCGGTIARYTELGHEVVLLYLNRGEWPENPLLEDAKSVRIAEARKACEILKATPPDIASNFRGVSMPLRKKCIICYCVLRARARMTPCLTFYSPTTSATVLDSFRRIASAP